MTKHIEFDRVTNRERCMSVIHMGYEVGKWVAVGNTGYSNRRPESKITAKHQIVSYYANGDVRIDTGERLTDRGSIRKSNNTVFAVAATELEITVLITEHNNSVDALVQARRDADAVKTATKNEQADRREYEVMSINPNYLTNIRWQLIAPGLTCASVMINTRSNNSNYVTMLKSERIATEHDHHYGDPVKAGSMMYEIGVAHASTGRGEVSLGAMGSQRGSDLNKLLLDILLSCEQFG